MDKKLAGGAAGLVAAIMYGGSLVLDQESRIAELESMHPEIAAEAEADVEPEAEDEETPEAAEGEEDPEAEEIEE
jgi:hypothetical protein|tara:strand:+ start:1225 stop:1449 length:225 start_codon:yes stop_codon:yes gene_type:complete